MPDAEQPERPRGAKRVGRRLGWGIYGVIFATFGTVCSVQILIENFAPETGAEIQECRAGVRALIGAVYRARNAAAQETEGERPALEAFRQALEPEWANRPSLTKACRDDAPALKGLKEIDLLRYAEEAVVRYEVVDLAKRRRRVRKFESRLAPPPGQ
jgi:hypothetical protein